MKNNSSVIKELYDPVRGISTEQYHHIFNMMEMPAVTINEDGLFLFVSNAVENLLGFKSKDLLHKHYTDIVESSDKLITKLFFKRLMRGEKKKTFVNSLKKKDGSAIEVSWSGMWDAQTNLIHCSFKKQVATKLTKPIKEKIKQDVKLQNANQLQMLNRITDYFYALNTEWEFIYANKQAEELAGLSLNDVLFMTIWECFPFAKGTELEKQFRYAMSEQVSVNFEFFYPEPLSKWFEVNAYPSPNGLSVFFRDITYKKRIEEERQVYELKLKEHHYLLNNVLNRITDAFFAVDAKWNITYSNDKSEMLFGEPGEQLVSKNLWDCFPKACNSSIGKHLKFALENQQSVFFQAFSTQKPCLLEFSVYPSYNGLTIFYKDITEKKRSEDEMKMLSMLAKETNNGVSIIEVDGTISWINEAYTTITGYTAEEAIGKKNTELMRCNPNNDDGLVRFMQSKFYKGENFTAVHFIITKENEEKWLNISGQPVKDEHGIIRNYFIIYTDITNQRKLEQQLEVERNYTSAAVLAAQEEERAHVGRELHDNVNQVLSTVKLYQELCLKNIGNSELLIDKSRTLISKAINDIRSLSKRLSAPTLGNINLTQSVKELVESITDTNTLNINLTVNDIEDIDVEQEVHIAVYRILQEHLTNILKHAEATNVQVVLNRRDTMLLLSVTDDGKGFSTSAKSKGIGLANMKIRAESLGGKAHISSSPGNGCSLLAQFPIYK